MNLSNSVVLYPQTSAVYHSNVVSKLSRNHIPKIDVLDVGQQKLVSPHHANITDGSKVSDNIWMDARCIISNMTLAITRLSSVRVTF